ncbi:MAG: hypothetical protein J6A59_15500 [Lachnospiraceae bacterium]|nr:hypothetical protein [Lachnospiraceae bacterium]
MSEKKHSKLSDLKTVFLAIFFIVIFLVFFNSLSDRAGKERNKETATEIDLLMNYDMQRDYPNTPRDVAKLHNRYFEAFYGKGVSDDELVVMNQKIRELYSSQLLMYNDENTNLNMLKDNITSVNDAGYEYASYELPEASQIEYYTQNGVEMATLEVKIVFNVKSGMEYMYVKYVMVKENDQWKIHVWGISDTVQMAE